MPSILSHASSTSQQAQRAHNAVRKASNFDTGVWSKVGRQHLSHIAQTAVDPREVVLAQVAESASRESIHSYAGKDMYRPSYAIVDATLTAMAQGVSGTNSTLLGSLGLQASRHPSIHGSGGSVGVATSYLEAQVQHADTDSGAFAASMLKVVGDDSLQRDTRLATLQAGLQSLAGGLLGSMAPAIAGAGLQAINDPRVEDSYDRLRLANRLVDVVLEADPGLTERAQPALETRWAAVGLQPLVTFLQETSLAGIHEEPIPAG